MIGKTISHYRVLEKLGEGGMGVVYRAEDMRLHRTVALKFLPARVTEDGAIRARFFQEARTASVLDHPNIATIYEIDEAAGEWFIAMAYVEGETLKEKIQSGCAGEEGRLPLSVTEAVEIAIQVAEGLGAAHSKGIIHRDIKSANIIITLSGQVKITDFGLAKYKGSSLVTKEGTVMGTPAYMSPEQARCEEVDHRSDIFSLGVILYEMLSGRLPFAGDNDLAVLYSVVHQAPQAVRTIAPHVPQGLQDVTSKAMEKEKRERYRHVDEMLGDLRILRDELETPGKIETRTVAARDLRKRRLRRISVPTGIVVFLILGFVLLRHLFFEPLLVSEPLSIAVISFENQTGEETYDYLRNAIPNLLITSLEQSGNLHVATWERLYDLAKQTGRQDVRIIDSDVGFELCRMDGIRALVTGSFTKAGDMFAAEAKVIDVETKSLLSSASSRGRTVDSIIQSQIDVLSREICRGAGMSESKIEASQQPIREVTTASMEAYNYFLRGREEYEKFYTEDARRFLEKAVQLDSTFAAAYLYLAMTYGTLGDIRTRDETYEKAKSLSEKTTDKERLYIEAAYAGTIENDPEKRIRTLEEMARKYPKEKRVHYDMAYYYNRARLFEKAIEEFNKTLRLDPNYGLAINYLAYTYADMNNFEKATEYFEKYASVSPGDANPFDSMAETYLRMGKLDEAIAKYREALDVKPDFGIGWKLAYVYALMEEYSEALDCVNRFITRARSPGVITHGYIWTGFYHYWLGNFEQALVDIRRGEELAEAVGNDFGKAYADWIRGWIYFDRGDLEASVRSFKRWFDFVTEYPPSHMPSPSAPFYTAEHSFYLGLVEVKDGHIDSARSRLTHMRSLLSEIDPFFRSWMTVYCAVLHGEVLLAEGSIDKAITACEGASCLEIPYMHSEKVLLYTVPFLKDVLPRAYYENGQLDRAIAEYERLIHSDPDSRERRLIHPKYHYRLATLYEEKGWVDKAIEEYGRFLEMWKDADPNLPEVTDARARVARLTDET